MLGYTLGVLGTLMIFWLIYLGRRKRNFRSRLGTVRGWVSAHVYFGTSLLVVATLHTGFQFGWNIHTLAFALMCIVIVSGMFGVWCYTVYPAARNAATGGLSLDELFVQVEDFDVQLRRLSQQVSEDIAGAVTTALERTTLGGGIIDQMLGRDKSRVVIDGVIHSNRDQKTVLDWLVSRRSSLRGEEARVWEEIVRIFSLRRAKLATIRSDIRMQGMLQVWLYVHVPLSFALLAALTAHIVSVFVYF